MFENLKTYIQNTITISEDELLAIDKYFEESILERKELLLKTGDLCDFVGFVDSGVIIHFHIKDGDKKTCDISLQNTWVTDFQSFTTSEKALINLQALEKTRIHLIRKSNLERLYYEYPKFETFGRKMTELVANRATKIAMMLSGDKPMERYKKIIADRPELFNRVPQKHIANFLGISPESLSRIRKRAIDQEKS